VAHALTSDREALEYHVFDLLQAGAIDMTPMPLSRRRATMEKLPWVHPVHLVPAVPLDASTLKSWLGAGYEGAVCKEPRAIYRPGSRTASWLKVKPQSTAEAVVMGYEMGKGASNSGRVSSLRCRMLDTFDHPGHTRPPAEFSMGWDGTVAMATAMNGKVVEFRHHGIQRSGKPRHPIFSHIRLDRVA
jgi:ATP-dependent DNA ligase